MIRAGDYRDYNLQVICYNVSCISVVNEACIRHHRSKGEGFCSRDFETSSGMRLSGLLHLTELDLIWLRYSDFLGHGYRFPLPCNGP